MKFPRVAPNHDFTVRTKAKNAVKSDSEIKEIKSNKIRKDKNEW